MGAERAHSILSDIGACLTGMLRISTHCAIDPGSLVAKKLKGLRVASCAFAPFALRGRQKWFRKLRGNENPKREGRTLKRRQENGETEARRPAGSCLVRRCAGTGGVLHRRSQRKHKQGGEVLARWRYYHSQPRWQRLVRSAVRRQGRCVRSRSTSGCASPLAMLWHDVASLVGVNVQQPGTRRIR